MCAPWVSQVGDAPGELVEGAAGTLEVLEGGRKQASKLLDASLLSALAVTDGDALGLFDGISLVSQR